jgi:hypothetical protein
MGVTVQRMSAAFDENPNTGDGLTNNEDLLPFALELPQRQMLPPGHCRLLPRSVSPEIMTMQKK